MPAYASYARLKQPYHKFSISDELESFYNVLLHVSSRYFHSNLPDVTTFLRHHFGVASNFMPDLATKRAPLRRGWVRTQPDAPIDFLSKASMLMFGEVDSESGKFVESPLGRVVRDLLWRLHAFHTARYCNIPGNSMIRDRPAVWDRDPDEMKATKRLRKKRDGDPLDMARTFTIEELAADLDDHAYVLKLLEEVYSDDWPSSGWAGDRLEEEARNAKEERLVQEREAQVQVEAQSASAGKRKAAPKATETKATKAAPATKKATKAAPAAKKVTEAAPAAKKATPAAKKATPRARKATAKARVGAGTEQVDNTAGGPKTAQQKAGGKNKNKKANSKEETKENIEEDGEAATESSKTGSRRSRGRKQDPDAPPAKRRKLAA